MWAMKAYNHAEVYYNVSERMDERVNLSCGLQHLQVQPHWPIISLQLISSVDPKFLKLTKSDEQIYTKFREAFPDLGIQVLDPELLKSADAKEVCDVNLARERRLILDITHGNSLSIFFPEMEALL